MLKYFPLLKIEGNMRKQFTNFIGGTGIRFDVDGDNVTVYATGEASATAENLTGNTLNADIVNSSLQTVGTISSGVWEGNPVNVLFGGTGATTASDARANLGLVIGTHVQAYDADLAAIAALTATTDNVIQSVGSAWASRTPAQLKATLALSKTDVGLSNVDNTSDATKNSATATLSGKRITKRVVVVTQSATPTYNTDNGDVFQITGLAQAITSMTTNRSGTASAGDAIIFEITDDGTARAITWGSSFEASTVSLPLTTVVSTLLTAAFRWNATTSKWRCVAVV